MIGMPRKILTLLFVCLALPGATVTAQRRADKPLTNLEVVRLVRAGFREKTVIAIIQRQPNKFELQPDRLIELKRQGVSENIILTMLTVGSVEVQVDSSWSDADFLEESRSLSRPRSLRNSTDIFGSGSGSNSQTKGRGYNESGQSDTRTTGSATVRIIRPPAEAGGESVKLEKTPTLTNEGVVKLVEAGFSEGTIIKRIEDSPVEFDLSEAKLSELRKRRVTEPIISAMHAAMDAPVQ